MAGLDNREKRLLGILRESSEPLGVSSLSDKTGWSDQAHVVGAAMGLTERGFASLAEEESVLVKLGPEGQRAAHEGLLESRMLDWLESKDPKDWTMASISMDFDRSEAGPGSAYSGTWGHR